MNKPVSWIRNVNWRLRLGIALVLLSIVVYVVQILIFREPRNTFFYMVQDLAFIPVQVLLVTLLINEMLTLRERRALLRKLNMVIGTFYSEVGGELLKRFTAMDAHSPELRDQLKVTAQWTDQDFQEVRRGAGKHEGELDVKPEDFSALRAFLIQKQAFLLALLQNPNLLEHESFSDLLWAVFHLAAELSLRSDLSHLPATDVQHLAGDIRRAYRALIGQWIDHMNHLRVHYPYLFSLAMRMNPFDPSARAEVG